MKKWLLNFVLFAVIGLLIAQTYQPIPEVQNLVSSISADTMQAFVQHLEDYQTRYAFGDNQLEIATWLAEQFQRFGYTNTYLQEYQREGMQPVNPQESIYHYASDYDSASSQGLLNGYSVGVSRSYGAGKVICLSFPLYNMRTSDTDELVGYVVGSVFNEPSDVSDLITPHAPSLTISSNYPNPFRNETTFVVHASDKTKRLEIGVYNLRGQLVSALYDGYSASNLQLVWDGKDNRGKPTGSGIYFLKAATQSEVKVSRILRIR
jgi:hypothetical protein